jgi:hypothetical protein
LKNNHIGPEGAQALAEALKMNVTVTTIKYEPIAALDHFRLVPVSLRMVSVLREFEPSLKRFK